MSLASAHKVSGSYKFRAGYVTTKQGNIPIATRLRKSEDRGSLEPDVMFFFLKRGHVQEHPVDRAWAIGGIAKMTNVSGTFTAGNDKNKILAAAVQHIEHNSAAKVAEGLRPEVPRL